MFLRIRDTNSCQQDRTRPFTHCNLSYKTNVSVSKAQTQYEDKRYNKKVMPKKEGRRGEKQPRRPGHKFKFWSMDIAPNTISNEPILMNRISVEPI